MNSNFPHLTKVRIAPKADEQPSDDDVLPSSVSDHMPFEGQGDVASVPLPMTAEQRDPFESALALTSDDVYERESNGSGFSSYDPFAEEE